jgi:hypothetical protein
MELESYKMEKINEGELEVLKKYDWSEKEMEDGSTIKNTFMQELIKKSLEEINNDMELLSAARINLSILEKKGKIPPQDIYKILKDPGLFDIITGIEFDKRIKGEAKSRRAIFLSLCDIWVDDSKMPINTFVSSESSAGKSFICKQIVKIFPKDLVEYRTKITPEAFTYWKANNLDWSWDGKICFLEDVSQTILDSSTFKVMCSEGSTATIVHKQKAIDIEIKGKPVMLVTSARTSPNVEILNRFQIISLDESDKQTEDIVFNIAKDDDLAKYDEKIIKALGYLKRVKVKINFGERIAQYLKEFYNFKSLRLRRDFSTLMGLIKCSAAINQFQRDVNKEGYILANEKDYEIARDCINYIQSHTFKGLTHRLDKTYQCCLKLKEFTAKDIHSRFPFVNQKMWYNYLDQLLERGMLKTELRNIEGVKQQVTYYLVNETSMFALPEFNNLPDTITNDIKVIKVTKDTNVTDVLPV